MSKILEKEEIIIMELETVQDVMKCLDQHPQVKKVLLGYSTKGNPTQYVQQKLGGEEWRVYSWTPPPLQHSRVRTHTCVLEE